MWYDGGEMTTNHTTAPRPADALRRPRRVLYLSKDGTSPSVLHKMAGIRRYCASCGWETTLVVRPAFTSAILSDMMREFRPIGCVVDGVGNNVGLPPRLFRSVPVVYIGYMRGRTGTRPNFHFDTDAIAQTAFRELSANRPPCYAVVGFPIRLRWPSQRIAAFRGFVRAAGARCFAFPSRQTRSFGSWDEFEERLVPWLAGLPEHCAVFAVCDAAALRVVRAARAARRHIPRSLTLVSVDNFTELCEGAEPPISSIQLDFERMGFVAARALAEEIAKRKKEGSTRAGHEKAAAPSARPRHAPPILVGPLLMARRKSTSGSGRHESWILEAVDIIRREACEGLTVKALIARFPQSRRNFERRFHEAMGCGVIDEILRVRLEMATTLLAQTDTAVGAIPDMCGFRSYRALDFHFRSRFKMGMGEWRQKFAR